MALGVETNVVMVFSRKVAPVVPLIAFSASSFNANSTSAYPCTPCQRRAGSIPRIQRTITYPVRRFNAIDRFFTSP